MAANENDPSIESFLSPSKSVVNYHFPELMSLKSLLTVLRQHRIIQRDDVSSLGNDDLVKLFRKFILPLPQREQLQRCKEKRKPKEMLKYIEKSSHLKRKLMSDNKEIHESTCKSRKHEECNRNLEEKQADEIERKGYNIVRISRKENEKQTRPVKLKRKHSKSKEDLQIKKESCLTSNNDYSRFPSTQESCSEMTEQRDNDAALSRKHNVESKSYKSYSDKPDEKD